MPPAAPTAPTPGNMTVPPLFGWEDVVLLLVLAVAVGVAFVLMATVGSGRSGRPEWEAWLAGRSRDRARPLERHGEPVPAPAPAPAPRS